jgi:hypothetical protein
MEKGMSMSINMNSSEYIEINDKIFLHIRDLGEGNSLAMAA